MGAAMFVCKFVMTRPTLPKLEQFVMTVMTEMEDLNLLVCQPNLHHQCCSWKVVAPKYQNSNREVITTWL